MFKRTDNTLEYVNNSGLAMQEIISQNEMDQSSMEYGNLNKDYANSTKLQNEQGFVAKTTFEMTSDNMKIEEHINNSVNEAEEKLCSEKIRNVSGCLNMEHEDPKTALIIPITEADIYKFECTKHNQIALGYYIRHMEMDEINIPHNNLGPEEFLPLSISISRNKFLTRLYISHNWLGDESVALLCQMLAENQNLTHLGLASNNFTDRRTEELCDSLASAPQLTWLDLSENTFSDVSVGYFSDLIATSMCIVYLNLSRNKFGELAAAPLGKGLALSSCLQELNISWNHVRGKGMKQFCQGVVASKLLKLNYSFNGIGPIVGCRDLSSIFKSSHTLEEIDLSDNRISTRGAVVLSKGLKPNNTLKVLKLGRNPIQTGGCYAILSIILKNPASQLQELCFEDIIVNRDFKEMQEKGFTVLPNLQINHGSRLLNNDLKVYSLKMFTRTLEGPKCWSNALKAVGSLYHRNLFKFLTNEDRDNDLKLSHYEFTNALDLFFSALGVGITVNELQLLEKELDPLNENEIDISEFYVEEPITKIIFEDETLKLLDGGDVQGKAKTNDRKNNGSVRYETKAKDNKSKSKEDENNRSKSSDKNATVQKLKSKKSKDNENTKSKSSDNKFKSQKRGNNK